MDCEALHEVKDRRQRLVLSHIPSNMMKTECFVHGPGAGDCERQQDMNKRTILEPRITGSPVGVCYCQCWAFTPDGVRCKLRYGSVITALTVI